MNKQTLSQHVDQEALLRGSALNAAQGAIVRIEDGTPVYIKGLRAWTDPFLHQSVQTRGVLRHRKITPDPKPNAKAEIGHGISGAVYVLEDATWSLVST